MIILICRETRFK